MSQLQSIPILKALSPRLIAKAVESFDRATIVIIAASWAVMILMLVFTLYTIHLSIFARQDAETAMAAEPALPNEKKTPVDTREIQPMIERLKHIYPDITFNFHDNLTVSASDGSKFHEWLTALSYVDTLSPQYHWTIKEFCVGKCSNHDLMHAMLSGEKITFEMPQADDKK